GGLGRMTAGPGRAVVRAAAPTTGARQAGDQDGGTDGQRRADAHPPHWARFPRPLAAPAAPPPSCQVPAGSTDLGGAPTGPLDLGSRVPYAPSGTSHRPT